MIFQTKVNGIPCQCKVMYYRKGSPAIIRADPGDSYPPEPAEFEFQLLDRRGRVAQWLEKYLTPDVEERLYNEYLGTT